MDLEPHATPQAGLATLAESVVDLHVRGVAERPGVACPDVFGSTTAAAVNTTLRA